MGSGWPASTSDCGRRWMGWSDAASRQWAASIGARAVAWDGQWSCCSGCEFAQLGHGGGGEN